MHISRVGGIIAAASMKTAVPMLQVGSISIVERIVITFQQAGIFPIVIITGVDEEELRYQLSSYGVIFISNERAEAPPLFDSVKIGLRYLQGKCDRVAFTPVNVPMFTPDTLTQLLQAEGAVVTPSCDGHAGHPVLLSNDIIPRLLSYSGENGLRGAFSALGLRRTFVEVRDRGILTNVHNQQELRAQLEEHNHAILHPMVRLSIERESSFFDGRLKLLLFLISDTRNVRRACAAMGLSYSKAWSMINTLELELGYPVVARRQGGSHGGGTHLTERGAAFLLAYQRYEEAVFHFVQDRFQAMLVAPKLL
nr:NTP transferase domain-containing protein [uncultured Oscillibacter sp.]